MAEVDLGFIANNTVRGNSGAVNGIDTVDTFSFRTNPFGNGDNSNINISLTGLTGDADVRVIRDFNGNGIVDGSDRVLGSSGRGGKSDEMINLSSQLSGVDAGSYIVEVKSFQGATAGYNLKVSASANSNNAPSLLLPAEVEVGALTSRRTFTDTLRNNDTVDTYRFNVTSTRSVSFLAKTTSGAVDAKMRLIQDKDFDREIDVFAGEELARSGSAIGGGQSISQTLAPGTYYLQVHSDVFAADYTLTMG